MGNTLNGYRTRNILKKNFEKKGNDSTNKRHNRGLNLEHKIALERASVTFQPLRLTENSSFKDLFELIRQK